EHVVVLDDRCDHQAITEPRRELGEARHDVGPARRFLRQHVEHPFRGAHQLSVRRHPDDPTERSEAEGARIAWPERPAERRSSTALRGTDDDYADYGVGFGVSSAYERRPHADCVGLRKYGGLRYF